MNDELEKLRKEVEKARVAAWNRHKTIQGDFARYKRKEVQIKYRQLRNKLKKLEAKNRLTAAKSTIEQSQRP